MKLGTFSAIFISTVLCQKQPQSSFDCPNLSWEFIQDDLNGNYCIPVGVSVTCDSRSVIVTFNVDHIYKGLNSDRIDTAEATAIVGAGADQCVFVSSNSGEFTATYKLDKCGTSIAQENGEIKFSNWIQGNTAALTVQGIIMTKILTFPVTCTYQDSVDLEIDPIHLNSAIIDINGIHENGDFGKYFEMRAYKDESLLSEIDVNNSIDVGQSVYVAIKQTNNIPGNVEYYLTGCTAYKNFENKTENFFQMIDNMCYADLIDANNPFPAKGGTAAGGHTFSFNAFAFAERPDQVSMQCTMKLCAVEGNRVKVKLIEECGKQPDECESGYSQN